MIEARPRVIDGLLKGMVAAEDFLKNDPKEAQAIVAGALGIEQEAVHSSWSKSRFAVRLDQALLTLLEDEGRWAIRSRLVDSEKVPNYLNSLHLEGLGRLKPEAVSLIR